MSAMPSQRTAGGCVRRNRADVTWARGYVVNMNGVLGAIWGEDLLRT
jgi:hypothetical protein